MLRLPVPKPDTPYSLFISDLHLGAHHPQTLADFQEFIDHCAAGAEALYILGDLFEYWAGDDDLDDPLHRQICAALRRLSNTRVYLMHGNRDLLMGQALADECDATLLADPSLIDLYGRPTLISHGDALCTDDIQYQQYRSQVRSAEFQRQFLSKSLAERKAFIEGLRQQSAAEKQTKSHAIMDVNEDAVAALLREHGYPTLIHGHTHRPMRHEHNIDGHRCVRWVLGDWERRPNALYVDAHGITAI